MATVVPVGVAFVPVVYQPADKLVAALSGKGQVYMEQNWVFTPACPGFCPSCCVQLTNNYVAYNGTRMDRQNNSQALFTIVEKSSGLGNCCEKCWCEPNHSMLLELSFYDNFGNVGPVEYTIQRKGCCSGKCGLGFCACADCCRDEMVLHRGHVTGSASEPINPNPLFRIQQAPASEAMFEPRIQVKPCAGPTGEDTKVISTLKGPKIFGGCSEFCCDSTFVGTNAQGKDIGNVKKLKPVTCCDYITECATTLDRFQINYTPETSDDDRVAMMLSTMLADYMLFEHDDGCFRRNSDGSCSCTCWLCYCCGMLVPCRCYTPPLNN